MKIGLIDIDSKIPNLALMKLSAYHKQKGDDIELTQPLFADQFDLVYASKIFDFSVMPILPDDVIIGGSGFDLTSLLQPEVESLVPDYSLYKCDYAIGYTSRGCNRSCPFCIVPKKEGKFRPVGSIFQFWSGQKRLMLLDNSLNTDEGHFTFILNQLIENQIEVDFSQGLDIRLLTDSQAKLLSLVRLWKRIHFAWDFLGIEKSVIKGIEILDRHNLKNKSMFYVLVGFNTTRDEDMYRIETLRKLGIDPFVMPFNTRDQYQRDLARWVNHKAIFKTVEWGDYNNGKR